MTAMRVLASATAAFLLAMAAATAQQPVGDPPARQRLAAAWAIQSSTLVEPGGDVVSTDRFAPDGWHPTSVPSTVLAALVRNGVYPDPRVGLNDMRIPDSSDEFNAKHDLARFSHLPEGRNPWRDPYWYRTEFTLPDSARGKRVWLNFQAINYRADVWLNGQRIADRTGMVGTLRRFKFDVTGFDRAGQELPGGSGLSGGPSRRARHAARRVWQRSQLPHGPDAGRVAGDVRRLRLHADGPRPAPGPLAGRVPRVHRRGGRPRPVRRHRLALAQDRRGLLDRLGRIGQRERLAAKGRCSRASSEKTARRSPRK